MTNQSNRIEAADKLAQLAVDLTEHPADAATVLMVAAGSILQRDLGPDAALAVMRECIDDTARAWSAFKAVAPSTSKH